jgi:hypothetical protein
MHVDKETTRKLRAILSVDVKRNMTMGYKEICWS